MNKIIDSNVVVSTNTSKQKNKKLKNKFNKIKYYENIHFQSKVNPPSAFTVPEPKQFKDIVKYNYRLKELKAFAKHYKQNSSKKKIELQVDLYNFLRLNFYIYKIQKMVRNLFIKKLNILKGPAFLNRRLCNNATDFYTLEDIKDIHMEQFMSFKDVDGFIYGFDILSLYTYIKKNKKNASNPYNRNKFTEKNNPMEIIERIVNLSKILNIKTNIVIPKQTITFQKQIELRALAIFQEIDNLGNYTNSSWLLNLNGHQLTYFITELFDIWNYRAQLSYNTKIQICPPLGNPFQNIDIQRVNTIFSLNHLKIIALTIIEKLVRLGINDEFKTLGSYYVLTALTIVSQEASSALPWLYQSVVY